MSSFFPSLLNKILRTRLVLSKHFVDVEPHFITKLSVSFFYSNVRWNSWGKETCPYSHDRPPQGQREDKRYHPLRSDAIGALGAASQQPTCDFMHQYPLRSDGRPLESQDVSHQGCAKTDLVMAGFCMQNHAAKDHKGSTTFPLTVHSWLHHHMTTWSIHPPRSTQPSQYTCHMFSPLDRGKKAVRIAVIRPATSQSEQIAPEQPIVGLEDDPASFFVVRGDFVLVLGWVY